MRQLLSPPLSVPPDINQWAYPADCFATTTTTEYDTEEEAEMALERHGRKKKHFKKTYHREMMKPQVYLDQQSSVVDASEDRNVNVMSLQEGDTVIEKVRGSACRDAEVATTWTNLALPSPSVETMETPFPKVLLNDQAYVGTVASGASTIRHTVPWTVGSIVAACYAILS
ncbi:uncharacterized protein ATC70_002762 [Mucor velutinosus]|uniref:Uncharacterized protein n=1 Tax=Mucor velutinosus TaxID=708070 RepID=A0AAN7I0K3_9FUNG|nr:hypothetical protein ATC70_002762 [Mucor velutinosus]